jgi:hypothetical protein
VNEFFFPITAMRQVAFHKAVRSSKLPTRVRVKSGREAMQWESNEVIFFLYQLKLHKMKKKKRNFCWQSLRNWY